MEQPKVCIIQISASGVLLRSAPTAGQERSTSALHQGDVGPVNTGLWRMSSWDRPERSGALIVVHVLERTGRADVLCFDIWVGDINGRLS
ncbi:hypothetical protein [Bradyrhizobium sp. CCBAU 51627]|uniref:hypothetical protein n=1 Tax=Bradyrhizobium sp. CCBAU 51627 TaxID=1325088 RepID=UPI0023067C1E|nr:hypothetical protein [Bradyrhizobium sp. CCBAU 51627]